jgi:hypothetical protein
LEKLCPSKRLALPIAILLLAFGLRLAAWNQNRFLEDEALYAYWGLQIATGADPLLDLEPVDKPPLHPYTLALSFALLGQNETAAQLPSLLASIASIALVYALGQTLYADTRIGLVAALLLALSPFDILFASTAFTDPLMTAIVLAALLAAGKGRLGAAGVLSGLAAATKQQGILFLPLVVGVGLLSSALAAEHDQHSSGQSASPAGAVRQRIAWVWSQEWVRFALGFLMIAAGVLWWDLARQQRPGFVEQSFISYGGLGPTQPQALGERAVEWLRLIGAFWVSPWFNMLLFGALALWLIGGLAGWWTGLSKMDLALAVFVTSYLLLHWLVGFQVWDRYLLGLAPLLALLAARAFVALGDTLRRVSQRRIYSIGLGLLLIVTLAGPILLATRSELPLGSDHGAYDGIDELAAYMQTQAPPGAVLYHHWLGYHYRFYLFGTALRQHWYPDLDDLTHDAVVYRREPRYIAFPSWRDGTPVEAALANADISLLPVLETARRDGSTSFRLYRLEGP